jgi:hypothetical protein
MQQIMRRYLELQPRTQRPKRLHLRRMQRQGAYQGIKVVSMRLRNRSKALHQPASVSHERVQLEAEHRLQAGETETCLRKFLPSPGA